MSWKSDSLSCAPRCRPSTVRILVVAPAQEVALRPTVSNLVRSRGVMRGPGIERKWRVGLYFCSDLVHDPVRRTVLRVFQPMQSVGEAIWGGLASPAQIHKSRRLFPTLPPIMCPAHSRPSVNPTSFQTSNPPRCPSCAHCCR